MGIFESVNNDLRGQYQRGSIVVRLVFWNVGICAALFLLRLPLALGELSFAETGTLIGDWVALPMTWKEFFYKPWTIFSYQFVHFQLLHLLFNMIVLYTFGNIYVSQFGPKRIIPLYLLSGIAGGLLAILLYGIAIDNPLGSMVGASGGVMGIVMAAATRDPGYEVRLFLVIRVKIMYIALAILVLDFIALPQLENFGGHLAHLGGAMFGYVAVRFHNSGTDILKPFVKLLDRLTVLFDGWSNPIEALSSMFKRKPKFKVYKNQDSQEAPQSTNKDTQEKVDEILEKISRSGYDSLTKAEKDFLFRQSKS